MTKLRSAFNFPTILSVLTATIAGIAAPAMAQETAYRVDPVAITGEPAPGTGGLSFGCFDPLSVDLGDSGVISFVGSSAACDFYGVDPSNDHGLWVGTPDNLTLAARKGDPAPGAVARSFTQLYGAFVNDSGDLALHASTATSVFYSENGVWMRSAGTLSALAMTSEIAPGTGGLAFSDIGAGGFNNLGAATFWASAGEGVNMVEGIWSGVPGSLTPVALSGDPAPGTIGLNFEYFSSLSTDENLIAFMAMTSGPVPDQAIGIWVAGPTGVNLTTHIGDELPGTAGRVLQSFYGDGITPAQAQPAGDEPFAYRTDGYAVNQSGSVAFTAYIDPLDPADLYSDAGIWVRNSTGLSLAAITGEIAPGTTGDAFHYFNHLNINGSGQVAFDASLNIADATRDHGIWAGSPGNLSLIVREGDPAPGANGETFGNLVMGPSLNDSGEIAFFARLSESGTDGVWATAADGSISLIALEGESVLVKSGDYRKIQAIESFEGGNGLYFLFNGFNEAGQRAFMATFTDETKALLLASPLSASPNQAPVANAGLDQTVAENNTVVLNGSASIDPDGTILSFSWSLDGVEIATEPTATVGPIGPGIHTVTLTVTDRNGASTSVDMILTVEPNLPPVANAGIDQTVDDLQMVTFDGSVSSDPEGSTLTYVWSIGPIEFATGQNPTEGPFVPGVYTITLTVTDEIGATATDTMILTVINLPPTADAGPDRTMQTLESIVLDGSGSSDPEGAPLSYVWSIDGTQFSTNPSTIVAPGPSDVGVHTITLTVTDNYGATASDEMILTVLNRAPTTNAGVDQTVNHAQMVTLDGSGSTDPEGGSLTYSWSIDGVEVANEVNPAIGSFAVGVYTVTLTVTDDHGAVATDSMTLTVVNESPLADAGPDQTVTFKGKNVSITLDGSASSDPEGGSLTYLWSHDGQPVGTQATIVLDLAAGAYIFNLTVTDDHGAAHVDSVTVTTTK